jgi:hypothetical protein
MIIEEQIVKIKCDNLDSNSQLEIIRRLMWNNDFFVKLYDYSHFEFYVKGEEVTIDFKDNDTIEITSYLPFESFNVLYKSIIDTIKDLKNDDKR